MSSSLSSVPDRHETARGLLEVTGQIVSKQPRSVEREGTAPLCWSMVASSVLCVLLCLFSTSAFAQQPSPTKADENAELRLEIKQLKERLEKLEVLQPTVGTSAANTK